MKKIVHREQYRVKRVLALALTVSAVIGFTVWRSSSGHQSVVKAANAGFSFLPSTHTTADAIYPSNIGYYNVRNYGAKGDGVADDTSAIQTAMQDALAGKKQPNHGVGSRNSTVYFPEGTYLVTDTLLWAQTGNNDSRIIAQVDPSRGCISGWTVKNGGSGYGVSLGGGPGLLLTGGGGSGVEAYTTISNGSIKGVAIGQGNRGSALCAGSGYVSAPTVTAVNWRAYLRFEGQNKDKTTIRLKDNTPKFANSNCNVAAGAETTPRENCPAVVYVSSELAPNSTGFGESSYMNDIWNLTINTGSGNPAAIALDWTGSNRASVRNVNLVSVDGTGRCGLNASRSGGGSGPGPGYINNLSVSGFDYGINTNAAATEVGLTLEHVDLQHQNLYGAFNGNMPVWYRAISSSNLVPAFANTGSGHLTIVDAQLTAGSNSAAAILDQSASYGLMFVRNVSSTGYASALSSNKGLSIPGADITEYSSRPPLAGSGSTSLALPVRDTPEFIDNNLNDWADVSAYGAQPNTWVPVNGGIQAALNSGKPIVYFPYGEYITAATLHIPSTVRKIVGANSAIRSPGGTTAKFPVFSCDSQSGNSVEIRNLTFDLSTVGYPTFLNNCSSDLVLTDLFNANGYQNTASGTGDLYLENTAIPGLVTINNQNLWARQLDVERGTNQHLIVNGGTAWVFGYKTEGAGNLLTSTGATIEVIGGFHSNNNRISFAPAYSLVDSKASLAGISLYSGWPIFVQDSKSGNVFSLLATLSRGGFPLYAGRN